MPGTAKSRENNEISGEPFGAKKVVPSNSSRFNDIDENNVGKALNRELSKLDNRLDRIERQLMNKGAQPMNTAKLSKASEPVASAAELYDNNKVYAKCDKVTQNGFVWQMKDATGAPGYSPLADGSESLTWAQDGSPGAIAACSTPAGGRRASRRRQPKKKATRRR